MGKDLFLEMLYAWIRELRSLQVYRDTPESRALTFLTLSHGVRSGWGVGDEGTVIMCGGRRVICGVQYLSNGAEDVLLSGRCVSFSEMIVCNGGGDVARQRRIVRTRERRRVREASEVAAAACGVVPGVAVVHHEGLGVSPRSTERRYHVHSVVPGARGVVSRDRRLIEAVRWVVRGVSCLPEDGR